MSAKSLWILSDCDGGVVEAPSVAAEGEVSGGGEDCEAEVLQRLAAAASVRDKACT